MNKPKKKKGFSHIKKTERLEIAILLNKGYSIRSIARTLNRSPSSISDEIKNNSVKGKYDPHKANHKAYVKRKYSKYQGMKIENDIELRNYVEDKINEDWSPEQIAGRIKEIDTYLKPISHRAIYKFIYSPYGGRLEEKLRYYSKKRRKGHKRPKITQLQDRTFIDKRPQRINKRREYGNWEGDLIVSGKTGNGVLLVLHERKSRYVLIKRILSRKTDIINQTIYELTGGLIDFKSLTLDNDISFSKHLELSKELGIDIYFCHPYHSWEKGGVENTNGLIRQYIPKSNDISQYTDQYIQSIQDKLNNRPRKCLNFKTPHEIMLENNQFKINLLFDKILINKSPVCQQFKKPEGVRVEG